MYVHLKKKMYIANDGNYPDKLLFGNDTTDQPSRVVIIKPNVITSEIIEINGTVVFSKSCVVSVNCIFLKRERTEIEKTNAVILREYIKTNKVTTPEEASLIAIHIVFEINNEILWGLSFITAIPPSDDYLKMIKTNSALFFHSNRASLNVILMKCEQCNKFSVTGALCATPLDNIKLICICVCDAVICSDDCKHEHIKKIHT